jgi:hypothetical protein
MTPEKKEAAMIPARAALRRLALPAALVIVLGLLVWSESSAAPRIRTGNRAEPDAAESDKALDPKVVAKLDQILSDQENIKQRLDKVLEELQIVKIRATVR